MTQHPTCHCAVHTITQYICLVPTAWLNSAACGRTQPHVTGEEEERSRFSHLTGQLLVWLWARTHTQGPEPHGTRGFSHFSTAVCNRQRQALTDSLNSEPQILRWTMIPQSLLAVTGTDRRPCRCGDNMFVTQVSVESFQWESGQLETNRCIVCFHRMAGYLAARWQLHRDDKVFMKTGATYNHSRWRDVSLHTSDVNKVRNQLTWIKESWKTLYLWGWKENK